MADQLPFDMLDKGVEAWNEWRKENDKLQIDLTYSDFSKQTLIGVNFSGVDLTWANLSGADLSNANLSRANLFRANLTDINLPGADLSEANLSETYLWEADLTGADFYKADFSKASLGKASLLAANLTEANLTKAYLSEVDLTYANLSKALLLGANLERATLVMTTISQAKLSNCRVYGLNVWDIKGTPEKQENLIITKEGEAVITVDDLEVAQFIHLLLKNEKIKNVIDTITSKAVLILGRFKEERKAVLDAIREELRKQNFTPILFDFEKPKSKDVTGMVETLARMVRFIIADLTDPSSIPHELAMVIPNLRTTPVLPICLHGSEGYSMFKDFQKDLPHRVLATYEYENSQSLIAALSKVIAPVNEKAEALRDSV